MLGVVTKAELVSGEFAKSVREQLKRIATGELNDKDKAQIAHEKKFAENNIFIWE